MSRRVRLSEFSLPLRSPLGTANGEIRERRGLLVGVESETGAGKGRVRGVGEATPLPGWTESPSESAEALRTVPKDGWDSHLSGHPAASHGYQLALLDAEARANDRSLAALLGDRSDLADPADSVPVNATIGDGAPERTAAAARDAVDAGFDCLKLKVGVRSPEADLERVEAVVDRVDAAVRVDANGAWEFETALELVERFAALGLDYVEQPVAPGKLEALGRLRGRGVDIAVDESVRTGIQPILDAEAADVVVLKPMVLGGPAAASRLAHLLTKRGVDPVVTTTVDGAVARTAAVHVAATVPDVRPCGLATGSLLARDLGDDSAKEPVQVEAGRIAVPDGPGNVGDRFDHLLWDE